MLRQPGLIAICARIIASVGCDGAKLTASGPPPPPPVADPNTTATVEFGGRVIDADAGGRPRVMSRRAGLPQIVRRSGCIRRSTTNRDHTDPIAANVLARDFTAAPPNQHWVSYTTEFVIGDSAKLDLAAVVDLFSPFVVAQL